MLRLETNHALTEAIGMYRNAGYQEVAAFNDEPYAHHWFEKRLDRADGRRRQPPNWRPPHIGEDRSAGPAP